MIRSGVSICLINRNESLEFDRETLQGVSQERLPFQIQFSASIQTTCCIQFQRMQFHPFTGCIKKSETFQIQISHKLQGV